MTNAVIEATSQSPARAPVRAQPGQYLTFRVADGGYAAPIEKIREILRWQEPTPVPRTPDWLAGVINLRGGVVPVIDLAAKFRAESQPTTPRTCIVVLRLELDDEETLLGVRVESVRDVVQLEPDSLQPPPSFGVPLHVDYLLALTEHNGTMTLLLDLDRILSTEELRLAAAAQELSDAEADASAEDAT